LDTRRSPGAALSRHDDTPRSRITSHSPHKSPETGHLTPERNNAGALLGQVHDLGLVLVEDKTPGGPVSTKIERWAPIGGIVFVVLMVAGSMLVGDVPDPNAPPQQIADYPRR
jgi:hypothetical protein